jgi:hypothetical protein
VSTELGESVALVSSALVLMYLVYLEYMYSTSARAALSEHHESSGGEGGVQLPFHGLLESTPCDLRQRFQVVLETEFDNVIALAFYASMGFMREKRLFRFYMNGKDAFRYVDLFGVGWFNFVIESDCDVLF